MIRKLRKLLLLVGLLMLGANTIGMGSLSIDKRFQPGELDWRFQSGASEWPALVIYHNGEYRMIYDDNEVKTIYEQ